MKRLKRAFAFMITCMMVFMLGTTAGLAAFAEPNEPGDAGTGTTPKGFTITIKPADNDTAEHAYKAYQIFKGTVDNTNKEARPKILSDIEWGDGIDSAKLLEALLPEAAEEAPFKDKSGANLFAEVKLVEDETAIAAKVAELLEREFKTDEEMLMKFAQIASTCVKGDGIASTAKTVNNVYSHSEINAPTAGYYLILDQGGSGVKGYSRYMLQVLGDIEQKAKEAVPSLDKVINEGDGVKYNTASIGDVVPFKITSNVPDMTGFKKYFYIINDTLSKGLTLDRDSIEVYVGGTKLTETDNANDPNPNRYSVNVTPNPDDGTTGIEIIFRNFIQYQELVKALTDDTQTVPIVITYSAMLNSKADLTATGNPNTAQLTYSNNPNTEQRSEADNDKDNPPGEGEEPGDPDKPDPGDPGNPDENIPPREGTATGQTPEIQTVTFSTSVKLLKVDGADKEKFLSGAEFQLIGTYVSVSLTTQGEFVVDAEGTYYLLKDGTYTDQEPVLEGDGVNKDFYASLEVKYKLVTEGAANPQEQFIRTTATTDENGVIWFKGLGAGRYTLKEIKAPDGYNKISDVTIIIEADITDGDCEWSAWVDEKTDENKQIFDEATSSFTICVENNKGSNLPVTGGIGTKLFYIIGGMMVAVSATVLVTRKRVSAKER